MSICDRQRLRLLEGDAENAFMQQSCGNGRVGRVDPLANRALPGGQGIRERFLPCAVIFAELVNQLAVGREQRRY